VRALDGPACVPQCAQWRPPRRAARCRGAVTGQDLAGFLSGSARPPDDAVPLSLRQALQELGYVEQQNVVYWGRWAEAKQDRLPGLAADLVGLKVDVIVTTGGPAFGAAKRATSSIPIVLAQVGDADGLGLIESPGAT
jgi:hypothetical protein